MDLEELQKRLAAIQNVALRRPDLSGLEKAIVRLNGRKPKDPESGRLEAAVMRFHQERRIANFPELRLLCYGLLHPIEGVDGNLLSSPEHLSAILANVNDEELSLNKYRRCYWALLQVYFAYDGRGNEDGGQGHVGWAALRQFLSDGADYLGSTDTDPAWVNMVRENLNLFDEHPCDEYAESLLEGDSSEVDALKEGLRIGSSSWFLSELLYAQVDHVLNSSDEDLTRWLEVIISRISKDELHRKSLLADVLDRYTELPGQPLSPLLRDIAVGWLGNPLLPSKGPNWALVSASAKRMVSTWLNTEFITAFFEKLSNDGVGDAARARFWKRYAPVMSSVHFGLTNETIRSTDRDMIMLLKKLEGLWTPFRASGSNNAFIMTIGPLVLVEFGEAGAVYGYDTRSELPFELGGRLPFEQTKNAPNSLKHNSRVLWWPHVGSWTVELAIELSHRFGIRTDEDTDTHRPPSQERAPERRIRRATSEVPVERDLFGPFPTGIGAGRRALDVAELMQLASRHKLSVVDLRYQNGQLWVRSQNLTPTLISKLKSWGFQLKPGKGWYL